MTRADALGTIIRRFGCRHIAEIGVAGGPLAHELLTRFGDDIENYYMVDTWAPAGMRDPKAWQMIEAAARAIASGFGQAHIIKAPSVEGAILLQSLEVGLLDLVFIDAQHTVGAVSRDIAAWWPLVKIGGVLSGHDYERYSGVKAAVDQHFSPDVLNIMPDRDAKSVFDRRELKPADGWKRMIWWVEKKGTRR